MNIIGSRVADPFGREEYVTITGHDAIKEQYMGQTKSGKPITFSTKEPPTIIGDSKRRATVRPLTNAPIRYHGTDLPPLTKPEQQQQFDPGKNLSMPTGDDLPTKEEATTADVLTEQDQAYRTAYKALAGAGFMVDVMNANNAYRSTVGQAQLNIMMARNQASDAIYRGRQAQLDRQSEGYQAGQDATLAMAAQGQEVGGTGVSKIQSSYEAMGIFNGMREEINAMREALGYELEEINYEYQMDQAEIARDSAVLGSAINFATTMAVY